LVNSSRATQVDDALQSSSFLKAIRARTTTRRCRRFASIAAKYVLAEGIKHGEREEPSRRSSTAFARSPRRVDASARRCTIPLPLNADSGILYAPPTPRHVLALVFPAHSLCKLPDASFLCRRCCARRVIAAPVLPAEGEMTCHGCSALLPCACSSAPSLHVLQHGSMLAANRPAPLSLRFVFYG